MIQHRKRDKKPLTPKPTRQPAETDACFGVRLLSWYRHNQGNGWTLDELPRPDDDETRCLLTFDKVVSGHSSQVARLLH